MSYSVDFADVEDEQAQRGKAALQARVIERQIEILDIGVPSARKLRLKQQLLTKLQALPPFETLKAPRRELAGEDYLKSIEFKGPLVLPQYSWDYSYEPQEGVETISVSDDEETLSSMSQVITESETEDSVIVIDSSTEDENLSEDEAESSFGIDMDEDSDSEDEDRFKNLNVFYI